MNTQKPPEAEAPDIQACAICAWRETCAKKYTISGRDVRCADYTRDLTIKPDCEERKP